MSSATPHHDDNTQIKRTDEATALKVEQMLQHFKCFSQLDVTPCLEEALSTLFDASLFDNLPAMEKQHIAQHITQLESQIIALQSAANDSEQLDDTLSKIHEKVRLAAQSYLAFIA